MRKLILFIALLIPIGLMAQTIPPISSTVSKTTHVITYSDGVVITLVGSNTVAIRKAAYLKAKGEVKPPVSDVKTITYIEYANLSNVSDKKYKVIPGVYKQGAYHENLVNVDFDLTGVVVQDLNNSALTIAGKSINVSYRNAAFKNVNAYQINCYNSDKVVYNGSSGSYIDRLKIDGFTFDGGGRPFHSDGNVRSKGVHDGVLKGFVFSNNTVKNNLGSKFMVYLGNGFDFDIFGNTFENINKQNNEDNGMFYLKATGELHNNKASNYQGYLARIWLHSIGERRTVEVYNNIGLDGDKYGLIELQFSPDFIERGADPADAKVYNNTALNLNKTTDWAGELLTLYNTFGKVEYYNNLGATLVGQDGGRPTRDYKVISGNKMVFGQYDDKKTTLIISGQNLYFDKVSDAVNDNLTSKHNGIGAVQ